MFNLNFLRRVFKFKSKTLYPSIKKSYWKTIHYKNFEYFIYLDKEFGLISNIIEKDGIYEKNVLDIITDNIKMDDVFIDIGANIGQHSLIVSRFCKKVFSFEPISLLQQKINSNIEKNEFKNIVVMPFGLSNEELNSEMIILTNHIGKSKPKYRNENEFDYLKNHWDKKDGNKLATEPIELKKLDSFTFESVDFIKIDIEGYEYFALQGAINTIKRYNPKIVLEYTPLFYEGIEKNMSQKLYSLISEDLNYNIFNIEENKIIHSFEELSNIQCNLFLTPKGKG